MHDYSRSLNPQRALIWRIVHRDNIPWILDNGLHCGNSTQLFPDWVHIGSAELIAKRASHRVVDWPLLQRRDFKRDPDDPVKFERYQAEVLLHRHCPVGALLGMVCYSEAVKSSLDAWLQERNLDLRVIARREWYFS